MREDLTKITTDPGITKHIAIYKSILKLERAVDDLFHFSETVSNEGSNEGEKKAVPIDISLESLLSNGNKLIDDETNRILDIIQSLKSKLF